MKIPQLKKKPEIKSCHDVRWEDNYSWIHQKNILEVLKDSKKLDPEVKKYLEEENLFTDYHLTNTKKIHKILFDEIKGRIKLDDESLPYKDYSYEYWNKTTAKGNYSIKLRRKIGTNHIEEIWNGDIEKEKLNTEYFGVGDLEVSFNDKLLAYSLDIKGSEYYTIYIRNINSKKLITKKIDNTSGGITFSLDDQYIFYSSLDENHRPRKIFRHKLGATSIEDELIFEEKSEAFTVGIGLSSDEKYFFIIVVHVLVSIEGIKPLAQFLGGDIANAHPFALRVQTRRGFTFRGEDRDIVLKPAAAEPYDELGDSRRRPRVKSDIWFRRAGVRSSNIGSSHVNMVI